MAGGVAPGAPLGGGVVVTQVGTHDPDVAQVAIRRSYPGDRLLVSGHLAGFSLSLWLAVAGPLRLSVARWAMSPEATGRWTMSTVTGPGLPGSFTTASVVAGGAEVQDGYGDKLVGVADVSLHDTRGARRASWANLELVGLRLPMNEITEVAVGGDEPASRCRFLANAPVSVELAGRWNVLTSVLRYQAMGAEPLLGNPLILSAMIEHVGRTALEVFPNTLLVRDYVPGPGQVSAHAVGRAVAFIDGHASLPITMADVAEAAGTTPRALRAAFRRHRGTPPSAYLRRVRLDAAHHDLVAGAPARGDTVELIARRWGFADLARFEVHYRATYGRAPEHTLHV